MQDFFKNIIKDLEVDLSDEFDLNFQNKSFFGKAWENTSIPNKRGSLMMRTGKLRQSIKARTDNNSITWTSSLPYASLQNEGGEVVVTEKMKRFFWAMFYKSNGAVSKTAKGDARNNDRNKKLTAEAQIWRALALQKVGAKMKIKQRQFIGDHPKVRQRIEAVVDKNMQDLEKQILNKLKR
jgi:phage gpG-like protein